MSSAAARGLPGMRKVIVQELVTVDGFLADQAGGLDFFAAVTDYTELEQHNREMMAAADTILLGAATYRLFVEVWPTADGEPMAEAVNTTPKIVYSGSLGAAPWGRFAAAEVVKGDAADHVRALKTTSGGDIVVWGSISLAASLMAAGQVDELRLAMVPTMIGTGRSLGATGGLTLQDATAYRSGIVNLRYTL